MITTDPNEALRLASAKAAALASGSIETKAALEAVLSELRPVLDRLGDERRQYLTKVVAQLKIRISGYAGERSKLPEPVFYKHLIDRLSAMGA